MTIISEKSTRIMACFFASYYQIGIKKTDNINRKIWLLNEYKINKGLKMDNVLKAIERSKNKLRKKDITENFGQSEVRRLETKYIDISDYSPNMNNIRNILQAFDNWCMDYTG